MIGGALARPGHQLRQIQREDAPGNRLGSRDAGHKFFFRPGTEADQTPLILLIADGRDAGKVDVPERADIKIPGLEDRTGTRRHKAQCFSGREP